MTDGQFVPVDSDRSACLDRVRNGRSQRRVGTTAIVIGYEFANCRTKMPLVHRDDEIQALAPDGPDHMLAESVRGGCSDWCFERIHDPSTVVMCNGKYYTYGTGGSALVSEDGWTWRPVLALREPGWLLMSFTSATITTGM
jgi:hypothetical protein